MATIIRRTSMEVLNGEPILAMQEMRRHAFDAERGSDLLYSALRLQFRHFALKHGVSMDDAKLFLMNSEGL